MFRWFFCMPHSLASRWGSVILKTPLAWSFQVMQWRYFCSGSLSSCCRKSHSRRTLILSPGASATTRAAGVVRARGCCGTGEVACGRSRVGSMPGKADTPPRGPKVGVAGEGLRWRQEGGEGDAPLGSPLSPPELGSGLRITVLSTSAGSGDTCRHWL
uniref:Secreted protein n=1 Tax=Ixodes ricinus TaxID=34613 RepID=A0A6B0UX65_IXORI